MSVDSRRALFLDRDGVINIDRGHEYQQATFEFVDDIFSLCQRAKKLGYLIFVVTNQSGIGRGYYSEQKFLKLTDWMCSVFNTHDVVIDKVYYCPFHPEHGVGRYKVNSSYRKPGPGMILQAAEEFDVDLARSILVGDKETDIQAGITAGVGCNLLYRVTELETQEVTSATAVVNSLICVESFLCDSPKSTMNQCL